MICPTNGPLKQPENKAIVDVFFFQMGNVLFSDAL